MLNYNEYRRQKKKLMIKLAIMKYLTVFYARYNPDVKILDKQPS